jgi:hypothetical protein
LFVATALKYQVPVVKADIGRDPVILPEPGGGGCIVPVVVKTPEMKVGLCEYSKYADEIEVADPPKLLISAVKE